MPIGLAGTNRIQSLSEGFLLNNVRVRVVCINPTENINKPLNNILSGNFNGVDFIYPGGSIIIKSKIFCRIIQYAKSLIYSFSYIVKKIYKEDVLFIYFYGNNFIFEISIILICKIFKKKIYKEESENPFIYFKDKKFTIREGITLLYVKYIYNIYSGVFVMTSFLKSFFLDNGIKEHKLLIVPHTVSIDRFTNPFQGIDNKRNGYDYIAYIGSLNQEKDGIIDLLKSCSIVFKKYKKLKLVVAGDGSDIDIKLFNQFVYELNIKENIIFLGKISSQKIPEILYNAKLLASFRPKSVQSEFGFPTKIVEYLATGIPIVTTVDGDLKNYVKDRINAFVVEDYKIESFATKIHEILNNYSFSMSIGQQGKKLATEYFDPQINSKLVIEYFKKINERK